MPHSFCTGRQIMFQQKLEVAIVQILCTVLAHSPSLVKHDKSQWVSLQSPEQ